MTESRPRLYSIHEMMRCEKYACSMPIRDCVSRQYQNGKRGRANRSGIHDPGCLDCAQGREMITRHNDLIKRGVPMTEPAKEKKPARPAAPPEKTAAEALPLDKTCTRCQKTKPAEAFPIMPTSPGRTFDVCKQCRADAAAKSRRRNQKNPDTMIRKKDRTMLLLNFAECPETLEKIRAIASAEWRTPEFQVMYWLSKNLALAGKEVS